MWVAITVGLDKNEYEMNEEVAVVTPIWIGRNKCRPLVNNNFGSAFVEPNSLAGDVDVISHNYVPERSVSLQRRIDNAGRGLS
ncbi:hypothetical protein ABH944_005536 [Caballeronia udeis]|uniref:Uncharacterized protein n=1 Tax=Caballeronia udeis TaxID=1232866 RepID=A0ABW8MP77_9BURK